jgi:ABC-type Fe3+ transport system permease subunit
VRTGGYVLLVFAVGIAFWAGSHWRHNRRTWSDHRKARADERTLRRRRWLTLRLAFVACAFLLIYLIVTGRLFIGITPDPAVPNQVGVPSHVPAPSRSPVR